MTSSLSITEHSSSPCECTSPEVCTPSPPCSPAFEASSEEVCSDSSLKATVRSGSAGSRTEVRRGRGRLGFPDHVYSHAAHVFQKAHVEKPLAVVHYTSTTSSNSEDPAEEEFRKGSCTKQNELWAYELAFNTLKFQELLEDVLIDSCFYPSQPIPHDLMALLVVMLYDFQDRKFQPRQPMTGEGEEPIEEVRWVESSLYSFRTKLAASLARYRIKQNLRNIDEMLPKTVREKHRRKQKLPLNTWVNTLNSSVEEVCETLKEAGFMQVDLHTGLEGRVFCKDTHCPDVLLFPNKARELLDETSLLTSQTLIIESKYLSLVASAVRPLLVKDADILMVGSFSAQTVAHVAVHASACDMRVQVCGLSSDPAHREELQATLSSIGCKNVHFLSDEFAELGEWDSRLQKVRVILLLPRCSTFGLSDPIQHIIHEDGDRELLQALSQGTVSDLKLDSLLSQQMQVLSHALTFPKVQAVVYCTCSVNEEENELLVKRVLENASVRPKLRPFRIADTGWRDEGEESFFRLKESDCTDGCFICVLKREQDPAEPESVQNILARAAAKGLLGGLLGPETSDQLKPKKRPKRKGAAAPLPPLQPELILNDPNVSDSECERVPSASRAASASGSSALHIKSVEDSSDSSGSSFVLNEISDALNQASAGLDSDNSTTNQASQQEKAHKRKSKALRRGQRRKNRSKSRTRTTKTHRSHKKPVQRHTSTKTQVTTIHSLTPASPTGLRALKASEKELQSLQSGRRRRAQHGPRPGPQLLDLNGDLNEMIKLKVQMKKYEKNTKQTLLPPISASSRTLLSSSHSSSHLSPSSTTSWSTGSYLSSTLSLPSSRSESRDLLSSGAVELTAE